MLDHRLYLRYYVGHKGKFGHEFLEFELQPDGRLRYANNSNYKHDILIRKELRVSRLVMEKIAQMIEEAGVIVSPDDDVKRLDDSDWPLPDRNGKQELEVIAGGVHVIFATSKIGSLLDIQDSKDPNGLCTFHFLVQDLKTLILNLISAHFKIKPI